MHLPTLSQNNHFSPLNLIPSVIPEHRPKLNHFTNN